MNREKTLAWVPLALILIGLASPALAQETVTIPKARLVELEREEEELRKLKGGISATNDQKAQPQEEHTASDKVPQPVVFPPSATSQPILSHQESALTNVGDYSATSSAEDELRKLKSELSRTRDQNTQLQKQHEADAARIVSAPLAEPVVVHVSPPMAALPPI